MVNNNSSKTYGLNDDLLNRVFISLWQLRFILTHTLKNFFDYMVLLSDYALNLTIYFYKKRFASTRIVCILLFLAFAILPNLYGQDTTPPIIITPAKDTSIVCGQSGDPIALLTLWYQNRGGLTAQDETGSVTYQANISLSEAITAFNTSIDLLCGNKRKVAVSFFAKDAIGNVSSNSSASFSTIDTNGPSINVVSNVNYNCVEGIRDTLIKWIKNKAGYIATDFCSNTVTWTTFQYAISSNNVIIQSGGGGIANGPYPNIPNQICNWRLNINFFVRDECGNQTITPGTTTFSVQDLVAPIFIDTPQDITVLCHNVPLPPTLRVVDYCDNSVVPKLIETTTKSGDMNACTNYNYQITRLWTITDACGNMNSHRQTISVIDTIPPTFDLNPTVNISCVTYDNKPDSIYLSNIKDNCSVVNVVFTDTKVSSGCTDTYERKYLISDKCGNETSYIQTINVIQNSKPIITIPAKNQEYGCDTDIDIQALFSEWLNIMGASKANPVCGELHYFAAQKGSFILGDTSTYPGIGPTLDGIAECPSPLKGFFQYVDVEFVYYDDCGNASQTSAYFGIVDNTPPIITACPEPISVLTSEDGCSGSFTIMIPLAEDACTNTESMVTRSQKIYTSSDNRNNPESIVHPLKFKIGPFKSSELVFLQTPILKVLLTNLDIDDITEYFNIFDEDGQLIGTTPIGVGQCTNQSIDIELDSLQWKNWVLDEYVEFEFRPNLLAGSPDASINDVCFEGSVDCKISYTLQNNNKINRKYQIDNGTVKDIDKQDSISVTLSQGSHILKFIFTDCALNVSNCEVEVNIVDEIAPTIDCPNDFSTVLGPNICLDTVSLPIDFKVIENCNLGRSYNQFSPSTKDASLLNFTFNNASNGYLAKNKQLVYTNVFPIKHTDLNAKLTIDFFGDNNNIGEYFEILSSNGTVLGQTPISQSSNGCGLVSITFDISPSIFNSWIVGGQIVFNCIPHNNSTIDSGGINPCQLPSDANSTDGTSYIQGRLEYSDASFSYSIQGGLPKEKTAIPSNISMLPLYLSGGNNIVTIYTKDKSGNEGQCNFNIDVQDLESPVAVCKNALVILDPSGIESYKLLPSEIDGGSTDNCGIAKWTLSDSIFTCEMSNKSVNVTLSVTDRSGNVSSCDAQALVRVAEIQPTYSAGLCSNDTLKLLANVPDASVPNAYLFHWEGPAGIEFFVENPYIPNPDDSFNGTYKLTTTGFNGCTSVGSVIVNIKPLTNPFLTTDTPNLCEDEDLLLVTTNYSGGIVYQWYEGIFPTGVLLKETTSPELLLKPSLGVHFYYSVAKGPDCKSNPSGLLKVTVLKTPDATVNNLLLSPCEGESIMLGTPVSNASYTYHWTGPSGYNEFGRMPRVIQNATEIHQGAYQLVINNGICPSDTAVTNVVIFEKPNKPTITSADIFCQGATFNLAATNSSNADGYQWYLNGNLFSSTVDNTLILPNAQSSLQGTWTVKSKKGSCFSEISNNKPIAIDNLLEIGATNPGPVCAGDSITLQATFVPNATYIWRGPNDAIAQVYNPRVLAIPGVYSVTITTPTLCQNNATTTVKVINVPEITAISNSSIECMDINGSISFFPSVFPINDNYTYKWQGPNGFISAQKSPLISPLSVKDTGEYKLVVLNQGCASEPFSTQIDFTIAPPKPVLEFKPFYCDSESLTISISNADSIGVFRWTTPLGIVNTTTPSLFIPKATSSNIGNYSVVSNVGQCNSKASDVLNIDVKIAPERPMIQTSPTVCFGDTIALTTDFYIGVSYEWEGPNGFKSNQKNPIIGSAKASDTGDYSVRIFKDGCYSEFSEVTSIQVLDEIKAPLFSVASIDACKSAGSAVQVCIEPESIQPGANILLYNFNRDSLITSSSALCQSIANVENLNTGTNFIYAQAQLGQCYSDHSPNLVLNLTQIPQISVEVISDDILACPNEVVQLVSIYGPPQVDLRWMALSGDLVISDPKSIDPFISSLSPGENKILLLYSKDGCVDFARDTVVVTVAFKPDTRDDNFVANFGESLVIAVLLNDNIPKNNQLSLLTNPPFGIAIVNGETIEYEPDAKNTDPIVFEYQVCSDYCFELCGEASVTITFDENIICSAPSIFTPNNDGINDYFVIPCLETLKFPNNKLIVFNEWGQEVYLGRPYKNDWDGTYSGGPLPVGTYFYVLEPGDGKKPINGFIIIQR